MILRLLSQWPVCLLAVCFALLSGISLARIVLRRNERRRGERRSHIPIIGEKATLHDLYVFTVGVITGCMVVLTWVHLAATPPVVNVRRMGVNPLTVEVVYSRYTYDLRDSHGVVAHGVKFCRPLDLRKTFIINGWAVLPSGDCLSLDCRDCWIDILGDKDSPLEITQIRRGDKYE